MSAPVRVSAVSFLNARPLLVGLDQQPTLFDVSFDVPSACADRLHRGEVDLGLIPAIEYLRGDYRIVPDIGIGSDGPIRSVALFTTRPMTQVRRLALDVSSRTSVALTRVLCATRWGIAPSFVAAPPSLPDMLAGADAALIIGDPALDLDATAAGVDKVDLGQEWRELTGLPFVYACWAGRAGALEGVHLDALRVARDRGRADVERLAHEAAAGEPARARGYAAYLRDNLRYGLGDRERQGLARFFTLAAEVGVVPDARPLRFY